MIHGSQPLAQYQQIKTNITVTHQHNSYPDLTVDSLIDSATRTWKSQAIRDFVGPQDVKLIESIPLSRTHMADMDEWHFTKNGKYTVKKSGYQVERVYPDKENH